MISGYKIGKMVDLSKHKGIGQFGPAYEFMLKNDSHSHGSIDRILMENMVRLCSETAEYLYSEYTPLKSFYEKGTRSRLEQYVGEAISGINEQQIISIARFTSSLQEKAPQDINEIQIGGTEEEIIERGSDWCSDVARVACALYQIAGFPARMVYLADTDKAYSGHVIVEVYRNKNWGAIDPLTNVVYCHMDSAPASVWELMRNHILIESHSKAGLALYTSAGQFRASAVSNYFVWKWKEYNYAVSGVNNYYRSILEMSNKSWPGGLRWLHGEDNLS